MNIFLRPHNLLVEQSSVSAPRHICMSVGWEQGLCQRSTTVHTQMSTPEDRAPPQWVKHADGEWLKPVWLALHTLSNRDFHCWDRQRERKESTRTVVRGNKKKFHRNRCQSCEEHLLDMMNLCQEDYLWSLNYTLTIRSYFLIIVFNEPQQKKKKKKR